MAGVGFLGVLEVFGLAPEQANIVSESCFHGNTVMLYGMDTEAVRTCYKEFTYLLRRINQPYLTSSKIVKRRKSTTGLCCDVNRYDPIEVASMLQCINSNIQYCVDMSGVETVERCIMLLSDAMVEYSDYSTTLTNILTHVIRLPIVYIQVERVDDVPKITGVYKGKDVPVTDDTPLLSLLEKVI